METDRIVRIERLFRRRYRIKKTVRLQSMCYKVF